MVLHQAHFASILRWAVIAGKGSSRLGVFYNVHSLFFFHMLLVITWGLGT
jgi:hypothetical protein